MMSVRDVVGVGIYVGGGSELVVAVAWRTDAIVASDDEVLGQGCSGAEGVGVGRADEGVVGGVSGREMVS